MKNVPPKYTFMIDLTLHQGRRKVWKSGVLLVLEWAWDRVNSSAKTGGAKAPPPQPPAYDSPVHWMVFAN